MAFLIIQRKQCESLSNLTSQSTISECQIESVHRRVKRTSSGWDGLQSWLFKKCFSRISICRYTFIKFQHYCRTDTVIPDIWRTAIVTPVPKVSQPGGCSDYRPISVTPILSRITQRIIANRWLRPSIAPELLVNQYAYKPTGSTTVALVHLFHSLTRMLENTAYVRAILIDFTKAFDITDHTVLISKQEIRSVEHGICPIAEFTSPC